jgi:hypothetical protein
MEGMVSGLINIGDKEYRIMLNVATDTISIFPLFPLTMEAMMEDGNERNME